jgi:AcrR family transcriptional regulator
MTKRERQIDRTRAAIMDAASDFVFGTANPEEFTMQNVADAAGVSHRTLYRYFPSRRALINSIGSTIDDRFDDVLEKDPLESFDNWIGGVDQMVAFGATHAEMMHRVLSLEIVTGEWRTDRDDIYQKLFRERFPHLEESEARQDFAVLRHLLSSVNSVLIGQRFELTPAETAAGIERGVQVLIEAIAERDAAAAKREEDS